MNAVDMNTFGNIFRLTSFGESHGRAIGGVIDGMPSKQIINLVDLQLQLDRRRPGASPLTSARREADRLQILSGVMGYNVATRQVGPLTAESTHGITLGTPIGFMVENSDAHSKDYEALRQVYRPSHADFTTDMRYGIRDWRGGGRASGRETLSRVVAGAFARQLLHKKGIEITSRIHSLAGVEGPTADDVARIITEARNEADSVGGVVECTVTGVPAGIGDPTFGKLQQLLASAMLSIGAVKGFEYGMGFAGVAHRGSEMLDTFVPDGNGGITTATNHSGGIQGGISDGNDIVMRVAVKPTPSLARELDTVNAAGQQTAIKVEGRHDPCIVLRVLPVVEAMAAMVLLDAMLLRSAGADFANE
jgi:chorismate synthase